MPEVGARRKHAVTVGQAVLLLAATVAAAVTSRTADWTPADQLPALALLAAGSLLLSVEVRGVHLSGAFSAIILAAALMGPAPALIVGATVVVVSAMQHWPGPRLLLNNFATYTSFPVAAGLVCRLLDVTTQDPLSSVVSVVGVFIAANVLNFVLIYASLAAEDPTRRWIRGFREMYLPVLPAQLAMALLTGGVFFVTREAGDVALLLLALIVLVFQWLLRTALAAFERGEQLEERNRELASLQVGLISTMLKTLSLRDHMTARHSAAVARYSRAMAEALDLPERERELIHTAALVHDIGKFIFPDSILLADTKLSDADFAIVRRHPVVGAELIGEIEGYGPVAELVRHHHERIDGRGYPDGLAGERIPLGSRIMSVADVYDVITARDTYRTPVSMSEAFAELRRSAGTQLDAPLVELFIDLVKTKGVAFRHSTEADFEAELALEVRVRDYAAPKIAA
jgi:putative nucleotidyltransferase with HDIG domain